ncbi:MAG: hypothetical protein CMC17_03100 [Flavobacteriaceae bacterium]|nr:hypothetical protein [Flavobacteriaceae bacterium]
MKKILLFIFAVVISLNTIGQTTYTAQSGIGNWNSASSWSPNAVPTSNDNIEIPTNSKIKVNVADVTIDYFVISGGTLEVNNAIIVTGGSNSSTTNGGDIQLKASMTINGSNLTVGASSDVTLNPGMQLIFTNASSDLTNNGNITMNSSSTLFSSLILKGDYGDSSSGSVTYARYVSAVGSDWDLIGSAVVGETSDDIISQSNLAQNGSNYGIGLFDNTSGANGTWSTFDSDASFTEGVLESAKGFQMASSTGATITFSGTYLDDNASFAITEGDSHGDVASATGSRWNLVANPYPAYISVNSNAATAASNGSDYVLNTTGNDNLNLLHANNKAVYVWGGTSAGYTEINDATSAANAVIAPGQGFFVGGNHQNSGDLTFNRNMMTEDGSDDGIANDPMEDDRAELFVNIIQNDFNRKTQIYFLDNTNDSYEPNYDAASMGLNYPNIYTRLVEDDQGLDLGIQSLSFAEMWDKIIPIGINANGGEEIRISISHNTTPADLNIYLEDASEGLMTDLKAGDYTFTTSSDIEGVGRFFIHMTADTMSNGEVSTSMLNAYKEVNANYITLEGLATQTNNINVSLYNILGRKVLDTSLNNNVNTQTISTLGMASGIYVIELESGNDRLTKKLIIQ